MLDALDRERRGDGTGARVGRPPMFPVEAQGITVRSDGRLLLDDVSSELDPERNQFLMGYLADSGAQVFLTTTDPALVQRAAVGLVAVAGPDAADPASSAPPMPRSSPTAPAWPT